MGFENEFKVLEIQTQDKTFLSFDPNQSSHRKIVSIFIKKHFKKTINLEVDHFPPTGADKYGTIICDSN